MKHLTFLAVRLALLTSLNVCPSHAEEEHMPVDRRLTEVRHLNMHYKFPGYATKDEWLARAAEIRQRILVSTGLYPEPKKCALKAKVFGKIERDGYSLEKVYFQSYPGFFVTGNLYRPLGKKGPFPGIANPHGHWGHGRLEDQVLGSIPGRCINFARQGYVAFAYDMVGYNDSKQVKHREWGGDGEHLWGISPLALQLWNSIRSVDFLQSLPEVDPERIACTGASGGGTQTFMLMAVDDRVKVAAPVNMISAYMQGGCVCENAPNLRTGLYNVELGAMMAPRPLLMVSATGDWTKQTPKEEYPDVRSVYALFGAVAAAATEDHVKSVQIDAPHNYNKDSREAVYAWFGKWLLGDANESHFREQPFEVEPADSMRVFPGKERAEGALTQRQLVSQLSREADAQVESLRPTSAASLRRFRERMLPALKHALSCEVPAADAVVTLKRQLGQSGGNATEELVLGRKGRGDRVRCLLLLPESAKGARVTVVAHPKGIAGVVADSGPGPLARRLLAGGSAVLAVDCFLPEGAADPRDLSGIGFFTTYNLTNTANRVQDLVTAMAYAGGRKDLGEVGALGVQDAGLWAFLAHAANPVAGRLALDVSRFGTAIDRDYLERLYVPLLRRVGDFRTAAALVAPTPLLVHNTGGRFVTTWLRSTYALVKATPSLQVRREAATEAEQVEWVLGSPSGK
jgi:dienelactone hydrolase